MSGINWRLTGGYAVNATQNPTGTAVATAVREGKCTGMLAPSSAEGPVTAAAAAVGEDKDTGTLAPSPAEGPDAAPGDQV